MSSGRLHCRIDKSLKSEYDSYIQSEFGYKRNIYGSEIENAMKFYLAAKGNKKYYDDPDVIDLMNKVKKKSKHASPSKSKNNTVEELIERKLEEKLDKIEKKIENRVRREVSKKHGHAEFKQFKMAFQ